MLKAVKRWKCDNSCWLKHLGPDLTGIAGQRQLGQDHIRNSLGPPSGPLYRPLAHTAQHTPTRPSSELEPAQAPQGPTLHHSRHLDHHQLAPVEN